MSIDRDSKSETDYETPDSQTADDGYQHPSPAAQSAIPLRPTAESPVICAYCFALYYPKASSLGCPKCVYSFNPITASAREIGHHKLFLALALAERFGGWVTCDLVAPLIWPCTKKLNRRKYAEDLLRTAANSGHLVPRSLGPNRLVYVLSKSGAAIVEAKSATSWGRWDSSGKWSPPKKFQHDLAVARLLIRLILKGLKVSTWFEIERANPMARKKPDGMALIGGSVFWIEAERSRKTGRHGRDLGAALLLAATGRAERLALELGQNPFDAKSANTAVVLLPPIGFKDDRKYEIDHKHRVTHAVQRAIQQRQMQGTITIQFVTEQKPWSWRGELAHISGNAIVWAQILRS